MPVRKTRTVVAKVCLSTALAFLLCGNLCQAAASNPLPTTPANPAPPNVPPCGTAATILAPNASTAQAGQGNEPIPCFTQDQGGGTGAPLGPNLTITFNPSCSYLPPPPAGKIYLYQAVWSFSYRIFTDTAAQFGPEGAPDLFVPAAGPDPDPTLALSSINKVFCGDDILIKVTLRLDITVQDVLTGVVSVGPSAFTEGLVHMVDHNTPPTAAVTQLSSPATGIVPYELAVSTSKSFDSDGWIIWAAIDWGDGSSELISPLPPNTPPTQLTHIYSAPGIYRVAVSVIDNGRMPVGTTLASVPAPNDPVAALNAIIAFQQTSGVPAAFLDAKFNPLLSQDFLLVQVPGNMFVVKGGFKLDFKRPNNDQFDVTLNSNLFADSISNAQIALVIGKGGTPFTATFKTDIRGKFKDSALGLSFDFNAKKQLVRIKLTHAKLMAAFGLTTGTVVNGNVDVPITMNVNSTLLLATTARFVYNAKAGEKGIGTMALSFPNGN